MRAAADSGEGRPEDGEAPRARPARAAAATTPRSGGESDPRTWPRGALGMLDAFRRGAGARFWLAAALTAAGAAVEGLGIVLLVPLVGIAFGTIGGPEAGDAARAAAELFRAAGIESAEGRLGLGAALFLVVVVLRAVLGYFRLRVSVGLAVGFIVDLRRRFFGAIAAAPWQAVAALDRDGAGHSLVRDLERAGTFAYSFWFVAVAAVTLAVYALVGLVFSPLVTLAAVALGAALFAVLKPFRGRTAARARALSAADRALYGQTGRFLAGLKPARAHRLEEEYRARSIAAADRVGREMHGLRLNMAFGEIVLQTAVAVLAVGILLGAAILADAGSEALIAMLLILLRVQGPFQNLQAGLHHIAEAEAAHAVATERLRAVTAAADGAAAVAPEPLEAAPEIALRDVTLRAAGAGDGTLGPALLDRASCAIPRGHVTLLAGVSGAGKTTFCDLVVGLVEPGSGEFAIDGAPATPARRAGLCDALAYVGQEPFLVETTLRENLAWGARATGEAAIRRALAVVGAEALVAGLPDGLATRVGPEGTRFSGGERQRLRLARALLRRPRFLVLDEATNALDPASEAAVLGAVIEAVRDREGGATVLVVSHRPATLALADHAIWLEAGRVVEEGAARDLLADPASRIAGWSRIAQV